MSNYHCSLSTIANASLPMAINTLPLFLLYRWVLSILNIGMQLRNPFSDGQNDQNAHPNLFVLEEAQTSNATRQQFLDFHNTMRPQRQ